VDVGKDASLTRGSLLWWRWLLLLLVVCVCLFPSCIRELRVAAVASPAHAARPKGTA
jgi:hypothetical protein